MKKIFTFLFFVLFVSTMTAQVVLPVTISYFTAKVQKTSIKLEWATESELNANVFEIERSVDAKDFTRIATIKCENKAAVYQFIDDAPLSIGAYYRLKQVDFDGKFEVFKNVYIERFSKKIQVFPNPSSGVATIISDKTVEIFNSLGQKVGSVRTGQSVFSDLQKGLYLLKTDTETVKFIVE